MSGEQLLVAERLATASGDFGDLGRYLHACERAGRTPRYSDQAVIQLVQLVEVRAAQRRGGNAAEVWWRYRALRSTAPGSPALSQPKVQNRAAELATRGSETRAWLARFVRHVRRDAPAARPHLAAMLVRRDEAPKGTSGAILAALGAFGAPVRAPLRLRRPPPDRAIGRLLSPMGLVGLAVAVLATGLAWQFAQDGGRDLRGPGPIARFLAGR
ncbi:hypothetical protein [Phenylobacterium sp.]|uniref:hypothetical protein n=1 Tax=Phenylobacterium sp. TaxID=1871053 RepID=UPI0035B0DDA2